MAFLKCSTQSYDSFITYSFFFFECMHFVSFHMFKVNNYIPDYKLFRESLPYRLPACLHDIRLENIHVTLVYFSNDTGCTFPKGITICRLLHKRELYSKQKQ